MNIHAKINPDQEAIARFVARVAKVFGAPATITTHQLRTDRLTCCYVCGLDDGAFERVTYVGALDGGVLVHRDCVWRFFRRLDAGALVPTGGDLPPVKQRNPTARERHLAEVMRQIKLRAFTPKDFFLTQAPPPVWIWQNARARSRWSTREQKRRRIARLMSFFGFTAHDLVTPEFPSFAPSTAPMVEGMQRAEKEPTTKMDMSKYAGGNFLKVADLKEQGPFKAKIIDIEIGEKFGKPNMTLSEGSILSLNATNVGTLIRAYGSDSDDWLNKEIELYVGETDYKGELVPTILIRPVSASPENKKAVNKSAMKKKPGSGPDMDDSMPF
jgi:hypothetical protein